MGTCIIKENLIGQSGTILVGKVASNRRVEKRKCRRLRHMEREGIKGGKEGKEEGKCKKLERKRERRGKEERKFVSTNPSPLRENFRFWTGKPARRLTLVSFLNLMGEISVFHLGFDNPKFGRTGETSQFC